MPGAAIDACCLIDMLATGHAEAILRAAGFDWQLPTAVDGEVQHARRHDPARPGQVLLAPADLSPMKASGVLQVCAPVGRDEQDRFVHYATLFRSAGEAMCIALAEARGWAVATDDRKAIRVARQAGLVVVSCPELIKAWSDAHGPDRATLAQVLRDVRLLARFVPNPSMPEYQWWVDQLANAPP